MLIRIFDLPPCLRTERLKELIRKSFSIWESPKPDEIRISFAPSWGGQGTSLGILITGISLEEQRYYRLWVNTVGVACVYYAAEEKQAPLRFANPHIAMPEGVERF